MPSYEVEHSTPLTPSQQDALAEAITKIHCDTFGALSIFVNVRFTNIADQRCYVGGKRRLTNRIFAAVRYGPPRTRADFDRLCLALETSWNDIVNTREANRYLQAKSPPPDLRAVFILGSITAGLEAGFLLPEPGTDAKWVHANWDEFQRKAEAGDKDFQELVEEARERGIVKG